MSLLRKINYRSVDELNSTKPSLKPAGTKKGLELQAIKKLEHLGATLIMNVGMKLGLSIVAIHTATFYFHR